MNYKLFKLVDAPMGVQIPQEVESDMFWFGCEWPYSYSKDQLVFGPAEKYTSPASRGFKLLQGSCDEVQSKDQAGTVRPYAYAAPAKQGAISWTSTCRRGGERTCRDASGA